MERRNFAALCAAVLCFWLFALAFGTAQGMGLHLVARREAKTASAQAVWVEPALPAAAAPALSLNCRAAILIEQDSGRVLYEKNAEEKMPIASITKVMTLLLTFEAIHDGRLTLDTLVPVSEHAYHMGGSQIWLEPGEQFTLDEMLRAICVSSANDAAVAVAELVGGSEPAFVEQMNARAAQLGCTSTRFSCPHGLYDDGNVSTAQDMGKIAIACAQYEIYRQIADTLQYEIPATNLHAARSIRSTNKMLDPENSCYRAYIHGMKTGFTTKAGRCYVTAAQQGDSIYGLVILGSDRKNIYAEAAAILDWAFAGCPQQQAAA